MKITVKEFKANFTKYHNLAKTEVIEVVENNKTLYFLMPIAKK